MKARFKIDLWLFAPVLILVTISLATLFSLNMAYFKSQIISLVVAFVAFFFFSQMNIVFLKQLKLPIYIISLILLFIVLLLGLESRGAIRWINIFGASLQFSEILKPFLALCFAAYLAENAQPTRRAFFLSLGLLLPVLLFIFLQPDLGNAIIYAAAAFFTLVIIGFPLLWFGISFLPVVLVSPVIWTLLHGYQRQRILTFLHPSTDPLGASYNSIQAIIAVGSGAFFGEGLSEGTQSGLRFLPERHTDFIFATIAEGLGFVGAALVLLLFLFLCYRIYLIFKHADDLFVKTFALCSFAFILVQCFMNVGMNVGLVPIVGVTLPFVSFGGSSLLSNFIFLGILSSLSVNQRKMEVLEIR